MWPVLVPRDYRHCEVGWNEQALVCLQEAEACRAEWRAGAATETKRVFARAAAGDARYRKMTVSQLQKTGLWRWRLSTSAIQLARSEGKHRERARLYLSFAEHRRLSAIQQPGPSGTVTHPLMRGGASGDGEEPAKPQRYVAVLPIDPQRPAAGPAQSGMKISRSRIGQVRPIRDLRP
jgi:hypothetical protein